MEVVAPTAQSLQAQIAAFNEVIAADKKLYDECQDYPKFYDGMNVWAAVSGAIMAHARLYRGEQQRVRHEMARYMRGEDVLRFGRGEDKASVPKLTSFWSDMLEYDVRGIYESMADQDEHYALSLKLPRESLKLELVTAVMELGRDIIRMEVKGLEDLKLTYERYTYAG